MKISGLNHAAFAQKIGTSASYISQMLSDKTKRNMGDGMARNIEGCFGLQHGWMDFRHNPEAFNLTAESDNRMPVEAEYIGPLQTWDEDTPLRRDEIVLPWLPNSDSSAGTGLEDMLVNLIPKLRFSRTTLRKLGIPEKAAFCLCVSGNSMAPVMPDGCLVGIDTSKTTLKDGDIYVIDHGGSLRVKILYRIPIGGIRLRSYNTLEWPDEMFDVTAAQKIRIIGRVFWWSALR